MNVLCSIFFADAYKGQIVPQHGDILRGVSNRLYVACVKVELSRRQPIGFKH